MNKQTIRRVAVVLPYRRGKTRKKKLTYEWRDDLWVVGNDRDQEQKKRNIHLRDKIIRYRTTSFLTSDSCWWKHEHCLSSNRFSRSKWLENKFFTPNTLPMKMTIYWFRSKYSVIPSVLSSIHLQYWCLLMSMLSNWWKLLLKTSWCNELLLSSNCFVRMSTEFDHI